MKYLNNTLYVEFAELVLSGIPEGTVKAALARSSWDTITNPADNRMVLIQYETLKDNYKRLIKAKYGDPYKYIAAHIIKQRLTTPEKDITVITNYKLPDGTNLPLPKQAEYLNACAYLHLLSTLNPRTVRSMGFANTRDFIEAVQQLIKGTDIGLPRSYAKLRAKVREYKKNGAACLIHKAYCNAHAKKVKDKVCEATLLSLIRHHNQFEDTIVAHSYNKFARTNGYKTITDSCVGQWRRKNLALVTRARNGSAVWHNKFNPVVHRDPPKYPLALINSDDNNLDLFYRDGTSDYKRVVLVVVTDAFNDYPLGYAIGWSQTKELVKEAYRNAVHHVHDLTGEWLWTHQITTDGWGISRKRKDGEKKTKTELEVWYEKQATFTPTQVGNARGKTIERSFGTTWHQLLKRYNNYGGYNITAVHKSNPDYIKNNHKDFPGIEDAPAQVAHFMNALRTHVFESGKHAGMSLQQEWIEAYKAMPVEKKKYLLEENRFKIFGHKHNYLNEVTSAGLTVSINGQAITYDVPYDQYLTHVGRKMQVYYDPYDLTKCLATADDARIQILCPVNEPMKMALLDMVEGDREKLNVRLNQKREIVNSMLDIEYQQKSLLERIGIDTESLLQAGVIIKNERQLAENNYHQSRPHPKGTDDFGSLELASPSAYGGGFGGESCDDVYDLELKMREGRA